MEIAEKIREVMQWSGTTQKELSERTGIAYTTLNGYLCGRSGISIEVIRQIADGLGVSMYVLLNGESLPSDYQELSEEERGVVRLYRLMNQDQREVIVQSMELFTRQNREKQNPGRA